MYRYLTWLITALAAALGVLALVPPRAEPLDAPLDSFSGARAHALVARLATEPHLIGSRANDRVRVALVDELRALGLEVTTRRREVLYDHPLRPERSSRVAWPENIVATLRGDGTRRGPGEAIALMSHYDSVPTGHGAADAMSGVASILEALRALQAGGGVLERDVVVLITDGEEIGLFGAQAFFRENPLRETIGLLLNFEARGAAGPANMFQTGPENAGWVRAFGQSAPWPAASSLSVELYRRMPNDTDATITLEAGIPFLNFAFIDDFHRYHAGADVAANLSPRSLQHEGDNLLGLLRHFGTAPWPSSTDDATYFSLARHVLVSYGALAALLLAALAGALAVFALVRLAPPGRRLAPLVGAGAVLASLALAFGVSSGLYAAAAGATPSFHLFYQYHALLIAWGAAALAVVAVVTAASRGRRVGLAVLAMLSILGPLLAGTALAPGLVAALAAAALAAPRRRPAPTTAFAGAILVWLLLLVAVAAVAIHASYLFAWPLLVAALAALRMTRRQRPLVADAVAWLPLAVALPLWLPTIYGVYLGLAISLPGFVSALLLLVVALSWPALAAAPVRRMLLVVGFAGLLVAPALALRSPFSARHPQPVEVFLALDATGQGWWASRDHQLTEPLRSALGAGAERFELAEWSPGADGAGWRVPAATAPVPAPADVTANLARIGDGFELIVAIAPGFPGARLALPLPQADWRGATLNGKDVPLPEAEDRWRWDFWGARPGDPIRVALRGDGSPPASIRFDEYRYGVLGAAELPGAPRGEAVMSRPWSLDRGIWRREEVALDGL